jgi:hypothetical protein
MTTVHRGSGFRLAVSRKKAWPESPPSFPKETALILLNVIQLGYETLVSESPSSRGGSKPF